MTLGHRCDTARLLALLCLLAGCAPQRLDTARLEAAIERFERAAAEAEAAARQAEASARQAELAAQTAAAETGGAAAGGRHDDPAYQRCATAAAEAASSPAQAAGIAARFTHCLGLAWGEPTATAAVRRERREWDVYRVEFGDPSRTVIVAMSDGRADLAAP